MHATHSPSMFLHRVHLVLMAVQVHLAFGVRRETLERGVPLVTPGSLEDL